MFKCLTDSLVRPKNIASHIKINIGKFILYFLLLSVISSIPSIVDAVTSDSVQTLYANAIVTSLKDKDEEYLKYQIKDNKLINNTGYDGQVVIEIEQTVLKQLGLGDSSGMFSFPIYLVFNEKDQAIQYSKELKEKNCLMINLKSTCLELIFHSAEQENNAPGGGTLLSAEEPLLVANYEDIDANGIDFSEVNNFTTHFLESRIAKVIGIVFKPYLLVASIVQIPTIIFSSILSIGFEVVFLAGFVFLFFRGVQLKFIELVKLVTFCMTPTVFINIFMLLPFGSMWYLGLYLLGQIITIVYFYIAIRYVFIEKIKKD